MRTNLDDSISPFKTTLFSRTSRGHSADCIAWIFIAKFRDRTDIRSIAPSAGSCRPLGFHIFRPLRLTDRCRDHCFNQIGNTGNPFDIDLFPIVGRLVIISMLTREEMQDWNLLRKLKCGRWDRHLPV